MKKIYTVLALGFVLLCACLAASCVTSGDLRDIELALADETKTVAEVQATVSQVADRVDERTGNFVTGLSNLEAGGAAGLLSALTAFALNRYRDQRRVARKEPV